MARLLLLIPLITSWSCTGADPRPHIESVLRTQNEAWNRGDLEAFFLGYWHSEKTVFASGDKVHHGFKTMADNYRKGFDTREKMGKLTFSELKFESVSRSQAVVTGRWALERENDNPGGVFTLIFRKFPEGWRIVHDHTSSRPRED